jgi:CubicO group peptidase (beta-lactamase class C family)
MNVRPSPRLLSLLAVLLIVLGAAPQAPPAQAAAGAPLALFDQPSVGWLSVRNMTVAAHQQFFNEKGDQGYIMIDAERIEIDGELRVSSVWQTNGDGRGWASRSNLTDAEFDDYWDEYREAGMRLIDQDAYLVDGAVRYAGIWMQNSEGLAWASFQGMPDAEFAATFERLSKSGMLMTDVESFVAGGTRLYSSIWLQNSDNLEWIERRDMTGDEYAGLFAQYRDAGFRVVDIESYMLGNGAQRYAAIWYKNTSGRGWFAYRDLTARGFGNRWNELRDAGYRLTDFEAYETDGGTRYAGVWRQNSGRPDWDFKDEVDVLGAQYLAANDMAGMSIAIAVDGKFVYLRGFGDADIAQDKWFHSGTVARVASGCKAVAGVLAQELDEKNLIDIANTTRSYVPALPAFHTHTLRQLLANRAGVRHYFDGADPTKNVAAQYNTQVAASALFAGDPLRFTPGTGYGYSTHGYTLLGAAMEAAIGEPVAQILREHLAEPYGISTLRAEDRSQPNANRATLYTAGASGPVEVVPDNISWKLLGGGCEISNADYTRLGVKLLNGSILSQASLDQMWTAPDNLKAYGLGWDVGSNLGVEVVGKAGGQTGAASYIRIYPERGIVITVLSNQRAGSPATLSRTIGELLLNAGVGASAATADVRQAGLAQAADSADEPAEELGAPELGIPLLITVPPTATEDSTEPELDPAFDDALIRLHLPLLRR